MKRFRRLRYALSSAWQNFWRNVAVSVAAVVSIALILMLAGMSLLLGHAFGQVLDSYQQRVSVLTVSIADNTPQASVTQFEDQLRARPDVVSVRYISKDEELKNFSSDPHNKQLIDQIDGNPLPAKIEVRVARLDDVKGIDTMARKWPGADPTNPTDYQGDFISNMVRLSTWLTIGGLGLLAILTVVSIVIVMNTIRSAVYHRRHEIEIMKLVGATEWFVRGPFVIEGVMTGVIAASLALGVLLAAYRPFVDRFQSELFFLPLSYDPRFLPVLAGDLLVAGTVLGAAGAYVSVRRFVKL